MSLTNNQLKYIHYKPLALKYGVSEKYVELILKGERETNTELAIAILDEAKKIAKIIDAKPKVTKQANA